MPQTVNIPECLPISIDPDELTALCHRYGIREFVQYFFESPGQYENQTIKTRQRAVYQINVPGCGGTNTSVGQPVSQPGVVNIDSGPQGGATYNYRVLKTSTDQALMNWEAVAPNDPYTFYPSSVSGEDVSLQIGSPIVSNRGGRFLKQARGNPIRQWNVHN